MAGAALFPGTARPPALIRARLTDLCETIRNQARSVFAHRGRYGTRPPPSKELVRPWVSTEKGGRRVYQVNREETYNGKPNWPYIASEYIHGQDLAKVLKSELEQGRALAPKRVAELCVKVAEALHTAHKAGVVHCDLKPLNILIDDHGEPHVMDFGLAKRDAEPGFTLTAQGPAGGTPAYSSPEQWQGQHVDGRTDLWALGVILFELLTGERPFRAERDQKLLREQIINDDPPSPSKLNSRCAAPP